MGDEDCVTALQFLLSCICVNVFYEDTPVSAGFGNPPLSRR